ncbi:hypothetical protein F5I97DRAFT_1988288 [Phlebopus sp. FC_14]|nr:hypothetical protein F5I97DRAFT_1988288 [Phlebopus sp. FC_14]
MDDLSMQPETSSDPHFIWQPPSYNVTHSPPSLLSKLALESDPELPNNFARTAKWCGDASSMIVQCENRSFQMFSSIAANEQAPAISLSHSLTLPQPAAIVDFAWYPGASLHRPSSFCFVASVRECPVKLLDGKDGRLRASYTIVDHRERQIAPHSLSFNLQANKRTNSEIRLYCGFEDAIEIFDVQRPGKGERLHTTPSKKSKDGLKGKWIISSIAFSLSPQYYAAGSLTPASSAADNIALFSELGAEPVLSIGGVAELERGGVTQLIFSPAQPHMLYASFRRSERLWGWDLRGNASAPISCLSPVPTGSTTVTEGSEGRHHSNGDIERRERNLTNQKTKFDIDAGGRWLAVGDQLGNIKVYSLDFGDAGHDGEGTYVLDGHVRNVGPVLDFKAHEDTIGAVAFHPLQPIMLSVSGSRHFDDDGDVVCDSDSESSEDEVCVESGVTRSKCRPQPSVRDASMKLWDFGGVEGNVTDGV